LGFLLAQKQLSACNSEVFSHKYGITIQHCNSCYYLTFHVFQLINILHTGERQAMGFNPTHWICAKPMRIFVVISTPHPNTLKSSASTRLLRAVKMQQNLKSKYFPGKRNLSFRQTPGFQVAFSLPTNLYLALLNGKLSCLGFFVQISSVLRFL